MMDELQKAYNAYQNALHHLPNPKVTIPSLFVRVWAWLLYAFVSIRKHTPTTKNREIVRESDRKARIAAFNYCGGKNNPFCIDRHEFMTLLFRL
jgi:hypothetical protein